MKCILIFLCVSLHAQTAFPTRVDITSNAAKTIGGQLRVNNSTNTGYSSLTYNSLITGDVFPHVDNTYSFGDGSTRWVDQHLTGKTRYWYQPTGDFWDVKANGNGVFSILDSAGSDIVRYVDIPASKWMFYHDVDPYGNNVVDLGDTTTAWKKIWTYDARLKSLAGGGTQCVQVDNNGDLSGTGGGCGGGGSSPPFVDTTNIIKGSVDATKLLRFEIDGFTTATTRTLTPQNSSYTIAGTDITQTFSQNQTFGANILFSANNTYNIGSAPTGTTRIAPNTIYAWTEVESPQFRVIDISLGSIGQYWDIKSGGSTVFEITDSTNTDILRYITAPSTQWMFYANTVPSASNTYDLGASVALWRKTYAVNSRVSSLGGSGTRCVQTDNNGDLAVASAGCGTGTVTSVATSGPISGGTITTTGTISCPTCFTTAGGQSVSGTSTFSTISLTTLTGTLGVTATTTVGDGGSLTIKSTSTAGNFYNRVVSDPTNSLSCSGVADGWTAIVDDSLTKFIVACYGSARYKATLVSY